MVQCEGRGPSAILERWTFVAGCSIFKQVRRLFTRDCRIVDERLKPASVSLELRGRPEYGTRISVDGGPARVACHSSLSE